MNQLGNDDKDYSDAIMSAIVCQITGVSIVCSTVCSGADQTKHQSSASLTFVSGIHRWPVGSTHKGPVTRITFPFDDAIISHKRIKHSTDARILWYKLCSQIDYPISIFFKISQSLNVVKSMFRISKFQNNASIVIFNLRGLTPFKILWCNALSHSKTGLDSRRNFNGF